MMHCSETIKARFWRKSLRAISFCLMGSFLLLFNSGAWATPPRDMQASVMDPGDDPVAIGETKLVPVFISIHPAWKSASVRFEVDKRWLQEGVNPASVRSGTVEIDTSPDAPSMVYVPVKVIGEGLFTMRGVLLYQMADGKKNMMGLTSGGYVLSGPDIFSFDGEVFFGGGIQKKVDRNLLREDSPVSKLIQKQKFIQKEAREKGIFEKNALSEAEEKELKEARNKEYKKVATPYFERYHIKSEPLGGSAGTTPRKDVQASIMESEGMPVTIGQTLYIPVHISIMPQWKSASISFEVDTRFLRYPAPVQFETVEIDASLRSPFAVYVPVKVTGEGLFTMKGVLHFEMEDGEKTLSGASSGDYHLFGPSVFSFDGEVFLGRDIDQAIMKKVNRNLLRGDSAISILVVKQWHLEKNALSKAEEKKLKAARDKENKRIRALYFENYPKKPERG